MFGGIARKWLAARRIWVFAGIALLSAVALLWLGPSKRTETMATRSELEIKLEDILSGIAGGEGISVMVNQADGGEITGVLVVADRIPGVRAYLDIECAVQTLLDVDLSKIAIVSRTGEMD